MRRRYSYTNKRLGSLTIQDYLNLLEGVEEHSRKDDNVTYKARCPLHHNHSNGDRNSSFIISRGNKVDVVYSCMSQGGLKGKCNQDVLTKWFVKKFKELKLLTNDFPMGPEWHKKYGRG